MDRMSMGGTDSAGMCSSGVCGMEGSEVGGMSTGGMDMRRVHSQCFRVRGALLDLRVALGVEEERGFDMSAALDSIENTEAIQSDMYDDGGVFLVVERRDERSRGRSCSWGPDSPLKLLRVEVSELHGPDGLPFLRARGAP